MLPMYLLKHHKHAVIIMGCVATLAVFPMLSQAGEIGFGIGYVGEYSDNINLVPVNPQDEWTNTAILGIAYKEVGPTLFANISAEARYLNYKNNTYEDGPEYYVDAAMLWALLPQQVHWVLIDRADRLAIDNTLPATPDNKVNVNVLYTGPDVFIRLGSVNKLVIDGRVGRASYSTGEYGSNRYGTSARWLYQSKQSLTYSLNYQYSTVKYDDAVVNDNYNRQDAFGRIDFHELNSVFLFDIGYTKIDQERGGETADPSFRLSATQRLTKESTIGVLVGSELLDFATDLLTTASDPTGTLAPPSSRISPDIQGDIFHTKRAELNYKYKSPEYGFGAAIYYRDIDYKTTPEDQKDYGANVDIWHSLSATMTMGLYGKYSNIQFQDFYRTDQETTLGLRFVYQMTRNLSAILQGINTHLNSTDLTREYTENRVLLGLVYNTNPLLTPIKQH
jgi:hypothetical protein